MKGPVEMCENAQNSRPARAEGSVDFSEYMWMAEEGVEEFDKKVYIFDISIMNSIGNI